MYRCCPSVRPSVCPVPPPRRKTKKPRKTKLGRKGPWDTSTPGPITRIPAIAGVGRPYPKASVPPPRGKTNRPTYRKLGRKGPWDTSTPWTNFKNPSCCWGGRPYPKASVPPPRGKTKRPTYRKLGRKGPWDTSTPGPITRSRGQRSRSWRLIALFAKNPHNFAACCPIILIFGRWRKDPLPPCPGCPRCHGNSRSLHLSVLSCKDGPIAGGPSTAAPSC